MLTLVSNRRSELYWRLWLGGLLWKVLVIALGLVAANFLSEWSDTTWQMIGIGLLLFAMLLEEALHAILSHASMRYYSARWSLQNSYPSALREQPVRSR